LTVSPIHDSERHHHRRVKDRVSISSSNERASGRRFWRRSAPCWWTHWNIWTTLKTIANLAVPSIADWCAADVVTEERKLERLAVAHVDPAKIDLCSDGSGHDTRIPGPAIVPHPSCARGAPAMVKEVSDDMIVAAARAVTRIESRSFAHSGLRSA
jgi:hypothetical protein